MVNTSVINSVVMLDKAIARATDTKENNKYQFNHLTAFFRDLTIDPTNNDAEIESCAVQIKAYSAELANTPPGPKAEGLTKMLADVSDHKQNLENRREANSISNIERKSIDLVFATDDLVKGDAYLAFLETLRPTLPSA